MHTLKIFWEMGNLTFSAMCVVVFVLLYSNITLGKASRTARTALFSFSLLIHIAFFAVSYIMYGNVAVLMLNDCSIYLAGVPILSTISPPIETIRFPDGCSIS